MLKQYIRNIRYIGHIKLKICTIEGNAICLLFIFLWVVTRKFNIKYMVHLCASRFISAEEC